MKIEFNNNETKSLEEFVGLCNKVNDRSESVYEDLTYEYIVSPNTGLGCSVSVRCKELKLVEDITDYGSW